MPYTNFYSNGLTRWTPPKTTSPNVIVPVTQTSSDLNTSTTINAQISCSIKTDVVNLSFKIVAADGITILAHFIISEVTGWTTNGTQIALSTSDQLMTIINFNNNFETVNADQRLFLIMEGQTVDACDEGFGDFNDDFSSDFFI